MKVVIQHPAPVTFVPRRGSVARLAFDRIATSVDLREVGPGDMPEAGILRDWNGIEHRLHRHEGHLWYAMVDRNTLVPTANLVTFLTGSGRLEPSYGIPHQLAWTPLHMPGPRDGGELNRGTPIEPARIGRILDDGRDLAQGDLARYVAGNLRSFGGIAFVRLRGPFAYRRSDVAAESDTYQVAPYPMHYCSNSEVLHSVVPLDAVEMHRSFVRGLLRQGPTGRGAPVVIGLEGVWPLPPAAGDVLQVAVTKGLHHVLRRARMVISHAAYPRDGLPGASAALGALEPFAGRAAVSGIPASAAPDLLPAMGELMRTVMAWAPESIPGRECVVQQSSWLETHIAPLAVTEIAEDLASMSALAPR